ncbi:MAG: 16S rRNA (adenine(1518)-N(6)/adenine(1519)-N(6))-dimethyltransferase RsmA [Candidatus Parvarchaeota archaeon]|nr:16S rRNA (adenine(1518)-N(6)/adenine(1519)-N(6))-dimethyltransferase RsmA [Candidatus Jingweiarchaeum tengchongense]MCW1298561.1 16S rRNA (adenine(1518)-N(6)/adenine(1519)-N(6))-dimethyltransferase RsmA [Candidatus Jingweiarchaeum tengchongense]MCW1304584.1 16S rRNA (adenine(1518)-N(6)/adenine(1519)-N(6))-dimethyltransferase RsmA [Candidatus Jingweiarchaeum tengchongense]MCW1310256.1 16S rRNA (adenine(1518)-N(6)/adenine(1519)-N(6))-dimethyltransferase RsmA [Candidatus Jingweiarchaeum tengchon
MDRELVFLEEKDQQHLIDTPLLKKMVELAEIKGSETVLEIGSGVGNLTELLAEKARKVYAIEIDGRFVKILRKKFDGKNVQIIRGNALKIDFPKFDKVVSNLPYSICAAFFQKLVKYDFKLGIFTVPEGFARIMVAKREDENYSKFSMMINSFYEVELLQKIGKDSFFPEPRVTSALIRIKPKKNFDFESLLLRLLFLQSDKKLKNSLRESLIKIKKITKREAKRIISELKIDQLLEKNISNLSEDDIDSIIQKIKLKF